MVPCTIGVPFHGLALIVVITLLSADVGDDGNDEKGRKEGMGSSRSRWWPGDWRWLEMFGNDWTGGLRIEDFEGWKKIRWWVSQDMDDGFIISRSENDRARSWNRGAGEQGCMTASTAKWIFSPSCLLGAFSNISVSALAVRWSSHT